MFLADYIFILLILLIVLLFILAIKYFKTLFFYLGVLLGTFIGVYGKVFLDDKNFNLGFLKNFLININDFFSKSLIVSFLTENIIYIFIILTLILLHRFFYYLLIILFHFLKWFSSSILNWVSNKKEKKNIENLNQNGEIANQSNQNIGNGEIINNNNLKKHKK